MHKDDSIQKATEKRENFIIFDATVNPEEKCND